MIWSCTDLETVTVTFGKPLQLLIEWLILNLDFRNLVAWLWSYEPKRSNGSSGCQSARLQITQTAIKVNQIRFHDCDNYILYSEAPTGATARCKAVYNSVLAPGVGDVGQKKKAL
jgi:hypothetical protein